MIDTATSGRNFAFLLVDKFSMFSLAAAIDTVRSANRLLGRDFYSWTTVSADGEAVMASNGLPLKIDYSVDDVTTCDLYFVCVGLTTEFPGKSKVLAALRSCRSGHTFSPRRASSRGTVAPSTGKTGPASRSASPTSNAPAMSMRSTASVTPAPEARRRST